MVTETRSRRARSGSPSVEGRGNRIGCSHGRARRDGAHRRPAIRMGQFQGQGDEVVVDGRHVASTRFRARAVRRNRVWWLSRDLCRRVPQTAVDAHEQHAAAGRAGDRSGRVGAELGRRPAVGARRQVAKAHAAAASSRCAARRVQDAPPTQSIAWITRQGPRYGTRSTRERSSPSPECSGAPQARRCAATRDRERFPGSRGRWGASTAASTRCRPENTAAESGAIGGGDLSRSCAWRVQR